MFILRDIAPDYGVDFTGEVITDARQPTNWSIQIQLRSEAHGKFVDGGVAISVGFDTSTLNYLFRGITRSIVVVHDGEHDHLYWEWTDKIIADLDNTGRPWRDQETVTVRVPTANKLDAQAAEALRREILAYYQRISAAQMNAGFVATGAGTSAAPALGADAVTTLRENGLLLVSDGRHREVLEALRASPETVWRDDIKILLALAFAYERSGAPLQALHYANRVSADALHDDEERALLDHIRSTAKLSLGQIDLDAHWEALRQLIDRYPESFVAAQSHLGLLARDVVHAAPNNRDTPAIVVGILSKARDVLAKQTQTIRPGDRARWALAVLVAKVETEGGDRLILAGAYEKHVASALRRSLPEVDRQIIDEAITTTTQVVADRLQGVEREANEAGAPEWSAIAHLTFLEGQVKRVALNRLTQRPPHQEMPGDTRSFLRKCIESAVQLVGQFIGMDLQPLAFRAKRLQGNAFVFLGEREAAAAIQRELAAWAETLGFDPDIAALMDPPLVAIDEYSEAKRLAVAGVESFIPLEEELMRRLGLPEDRRYFLREDSLVMQIVAREQLAWCRHLNVLQDLTHTQDPNTHYARSPDRAAHCALLKHQSKILEPHALAVIAAFKRAYCESCDQRDPFEKQ